jgi:hypothetical protein
MNAATVESRIRQFLLILSILSIGATLTELILLEHTDGLLQLIPFGLSGIGAVVVIAALLRPRRTTLRWLRVAMVIVAVGGLFGVGIHLRENILFEQDIRPNAATLDIIVNAVKGASPLFAPSALVFAALLALLATYYHPVFGRREAAPNL